MAVITQAQVHSLKRQLHDAHEHVLHTETAYRLSGDRIGATRCKALARSILVEIGYLNLCITG